MTKRPDRARAAAARTIRLDAAIDAILEHFEEVQMDFYGCDPAEQKEHAWQQLEPIEDAFRTLEFWQDVIAELDD